MRTSIIFLAGAFATAVSAFGIALGTPEGVYEVFVDESGAEHHTKIANASTTTSAARRQPTVERRQGPYWDLFRLYGGWACPGGDRLDSRNTDDAVGDLDGQCGGGLRVAPRHHIYAVRGDVAAFFCNFEDSSAFDVRCHASDRRAVAAEITRRCGSYYGGWGVIDSWVYISIGYHRVDGSKTFCGEGHHRAQAEGGGSPGVEGSS